MTPSSIVFKLVGRFTVSNKEQTKLPPKNCLYVQKLNLFASLSFACISHERPNADLFGKGKRLGMGIKPFIAVRALHIETNGPIGLAIVVILEREIMGIEFGQGCHRTALAAPRVLHHGKKRWLVQLLISQCPGFLGGGGGLGRGGFFLSLPFGGGFGCLLLI